MSEQLPRIITADCSFPREIDDGLYVETLDESYELYRVGVCVADTSSLYKYPEVVRQAHDRTAARYWNLPNGERGYDPMVEPELIRGLELKAGTVRKALLVSFLVGPKHPPHGVDISFGKVEIERNISYKEFAQLVAGNKNQRFYRASRLIDHHLGYVAYGDHVGSRPAWSQEQEGIPNISGNAWRRGSKINEAFMVATNHLVGKVMVAEDRPAIYRVHDPNDEQYLELLSASVARYSRTPGPHAGLGLEPYCRVTSPLRRLDDFVMNHQLKLRDEGRLPSTQDTRDVAFAIRRLNQELVAAAPKEASRFRAQDILGRFAVQVPQHVAAAG